jgi:hypothetical protein
VGLAAELPVVAVHVANAAGLPAFADPRAFMMALLFASAAGYLPSRPVLVWMASRAYLGQPLGPREAAAATVRRFGDFVGATLVTWTALAAGWVMFLLPAMVVSLLFFAVVPVVMVEGASPLVALRRSVKLANRAPAPVFGLWAVLNVIVWGATLAGAVVGLFAASTFVLGQQGRVDAVSMTAASLAGGIAQPLAVIGMTLLYYDRRVRTEALDLAAVPAPVSAEPALA